MRSHNSFYTRNFRGGGTVNEALLWLHRQYLRAQAGALETARAQLEAYPERVRSRPGMLLGSASWCCSLIELAALLDDADLAEVPAGPLAEMYERGQVFTSGLVFHIPRVLGVAMRLRGDLDEAVARLERAVGETEEMGARSEHALALLDLARALVDRGDAGERSFRTASMARGELAALGMTPFVTSADRLLERLVYSGKAPHPGMRVKDAPSGTYTMLFSDMEGSTALAQRLGDLKARDVMREHHDIVRAQIAAHGGNEVDLQGDGFLIAFGSARDALLCAIGIQRAFRTRNEMSPAVPIRVRIGLHTGEAIREERTFFGLSVILASRIAAQAQAGQILVSGLVRSLTQTAGDIRFGPEREVPLKGFAEPQKIVEVHWE